MNDIISPLIRSFSNPASILVLVLISFSALPAAPLDTKNVMSGMGALAYISESDGRDAIFIRDSDVNNVIFSCSSGNVIILTPSVSSDGNYITFLVDNGRNQKTIHILGPLQKVNNRWQAHDLEVMTVRGGAWPVFNNDQSVYMSMPEQTSLSNDGTTNIYLIGTDGIKQISDNLGVSSHIWPLINPNKDALIYRYIPQPDEMGYTAEPVKSIIMSLDSGSSEMHFVDQFVYLEQWTSLGEILFSFRDKDQNGNRIYALYNTETRATKEIYRNKSRQGALTSDSKFLATIRPVPEGNPQFDIFVTDLISTTEINLTQSPGQSESLIGWIK
ncbi:MAG: hypothetical protein HQ506_05330 [Candidatus Marinimicrobia bacterium]|nr:hypothetical protein [Candidatus Neomarinimicrobiota bacterium]